MTIRGVSSLESMILDAVYKEKEIADEVIEQDRLEVLDLLGKHLTYDLPIDILERFERILKNVLRQSMKGRVSGSDARELALFQKRLGLLLKYKSYCIKAASPLGYSIFIQNEGEGFSFQQHLRHKTEVFHILEVQSGGYVFICDFRDWVRLYERGSFSAWLEGSHDERWEQYRFVPKPGDVFTIDRLGVVHSVVGCTLEEFATVSTDMVDRLHDQNAGKPIPQSFNHRYAQQRLSAISSPSVSRYVATPPHEQRITELAPVKIPGGQVVRLACAPLNASRFSVEPSQSSALQVDESCAVSLYVIGGKGRVILGDSAEIHRFTPPSCEVRAGDPLMVAPGMYYGFVSEGPSPLILSEHKIPIEVAFV